MQNGDYYNQLGINRDAQGEDIAKAFRRMALKYHPELTEEGDAQAKAKRKKAFDQIAEAYEVLSNAKLRAVFDEYGEGGLKKGGHGHEGYSFSGDSDAIFKQFFGVANPFQAVGGSASEGTKHLFFSQSGGGPSPSPQLPPTDLSVECSLEELYSGVTRMVVAETDLVDFDGKPYKKHETVISFDVEPGLPGGSRLKFPKKGVQKDGDLSAGDVFVVVQQKKHPDFVRKGDDLLFTQAITLEQALCGFNIDVKMLDGRLLSVFINDVVHPQYQKVIKGEGMPVYRGGGARGDLVLAFDTTFPSYLTEGQKKEISRILNSENAAKA